MKTIVATAYLSMFTRQSCYAALLLGSMTELVAAQESASTQSTPTTDAPTYRVGDTWTFSWGNTGTGPEGKGVQVQKVASVTEDETTPSTTVS
jgi:hypothetical protein